VNTVKKLDGTNNISFSKEHTVFRNYNYVYLFFLSSDTDFKQIISVFLSLEMKITLHNINLLVMILHRKVWKNMEQKLYISFGISVSYM
jgi:hypothetical protein